MVVNRLIVLNARHPLTHIEKAKAPFQTGKQFLINAAWTFTWPQKKQSVLAIDLIAVRNEKSLHETAKRLLHQRKICLVELQSL